jgi:hypothetical protein
LLLLGVCSSNSRTFCPSDFYHAASIHAELFAWSQVATVTTPTGDAAMDHTSHVRLTSSELTSDTLEGATIYGADDEKVGTVSHLHGSEVVVDVGGFLGIGAKPVAVPANQLDFMRDEDGDVHAVTTWTKDQLKDMPEHQD